MTVKDMLDLYQGWIDEYEEKREKIMSEGFAKEVAYAFCMGVMLGLNNAYIELQKYEKEGLEP